MRRGWGVAPGRLPVDRAAGCLSTEQQAGSLCYDGPPVRQDRRIRVSTGILPIDPGFRRRVLALCRVLDELYGPGENESGRKL